MSAAAPPARVTELHAGSVVSVARKIQYYFASKPEKNYRSF